ncbi:DUF535 family protein [Vagococcus sp. WN89Y]|uniref:DUF535 family protein n=1 Tax=Vagococcus sp. WN89Y TaxID=3457258 RepID=UPI003FCE8A5E
MGGVYVGNGFYRLPVQLPRKMAEDIPVRKREEYRRRNALLDAVHSQPQAQMNPDSQRAQTHKRLNNKYQSR